MVKKISIILIVALNFVLAQKVSVKSTETIQLKNSGEAFYPKFTKDDSGIIFTSSNYKGLSLYNFATKREEVITTEQGAGFRPQIMADNIVYRKFDFVNKLKYFTVKNYNIENKTAKVLIKNKRTLKLPNQIVTSKILLVEDSVPQMIKVSEKSLQKASLPNIALLIEGDDLLLIENERKTKLNPLGEGAYVWASLSNDGTKILFTFGTQGAFVCDLNGNVILNVKEAHYPKFSPDDKFISYMIDKDDGHVFTSSDIFIYSIDDKESFRITDTDNKIEMYPEWSNSGDKLVYNTTQGELIISELEIKK
ncbi:MAG: hypothetical protein CR986_07255 [Ignavibacteriae bacterium]|nr:MAG: hypothetical protein CR986_07255 [Ignavibacteriota bacterium]